MQSGNNPQLESPQSEKTEQQAAKPKDPGSDVCNLEWPVLTPKSSGEPVKSYWQSSLWYTKSNAQQRNNGCLGFSLDSDSSASQLKPG